MTVAIGAFGIDQAFGHTAIVAKIDLANEEGFYMTHQKVIHTEPDKESHLEKFHRARYIAEQLNQFMAEIFEEYKQQETVWCFAIEGLSHGSFGKAAAANRDLAGLQYVVINSLNHFPEDKSYIVAPKALKKYATGIGNATKDQMLEMIEKYDEMFYENVLMNTPKTKGRFDLADAFWLAEYAYEQCKKDLGLWEEEGG